MPIESKPIRKTDDSAMALLYDILGDDTSKILDIDSYYRIKGKYIFLEFIKVENSVQDYSLPSNWIAVQNEILTIWEFVNKAEGVLWLICYSVDRSAFKLFLVESATTTKITFQRENICDFEKFKQFIQVLNAEVLKG